MNLVKRNTLLVVIVAIFILNIFLWYIVYAELPSNTMTVAFLNIGQGDAIYIESPTHNQLLIDGGPPKSVVGELGNVMHFYDRSIDMILATHPDQDHIAGLVDVLDAYAIKNEMEPGVTSGSGAYTELERLIHDKNIKQMLARRGMIVHLGGGADLHILFPDRSVVGWETNTGSIIAKLTYGDTSMMLTGDAPISTEEYTTKLNPTIMKSDVLKAGHHGSKTSASELFTEAVSPKYAVISAGYKNKFGHPHKEMTDIFQKLKIPILGTYERGRIVFISGGKTLTLK